MGVGRAKGPRVSIRDLCSAGCKGGEENSEGGLSSDTLGFPAGTETDWVGWKKSSIVKGRIAGAARVLGMDVEDDHCPVCWLAGSRSLSLAVRTLDRGESESGREVSLAVRALGRGESVSGRAVRPAWGAASRSNLELSMTAADDFVRLPA